MTLGLYDPGWSAERDEAERFYRECAEPRERPTPDEYMDRERALDELGDEATGLDYEDGGEW